MESKGKDEIAEMTSKMQKMDEMLNDFKAVLKLTDSFIQNGTVPSKNKDNITSDNNSTLINI